MANWLSYPRHMKFCAMQYANGVSLFDPIPASGDEGGYAPLMGVQSARLPKSGFWGRNQVTAPYGGELGSYRLGWGRSNRPHLLRVRLQGCRMNLPPF